MGETIGGGSAIEFPPDVGSPTTPIGLEQLSDVDLTSPDDLQQIVFDEASGQWKNVDPPAIPDSPKGSVFPDVATYGEWIVRGDAGAIVVTGALNAATSVTSGSGLSTDANGAFGQYATAASVNSNAGANESASLTRIQWGCALCFKFAITSVADGRAFIGWCSNAGQITQASYLGSSNFVGIGYDKVLGHTNWQFVAEGGSDSSHIYVDSGIPLAANTVLILEIDAEDRANVDVVIKDNLGVVLASHRFLAVDIPSAANNLVSACVIATPSSGSPAARTLKLYRWAVLRRA